ncbi:hypothetical protein AMTR_s00088p00042740 [Amborella trichopoda]|uniref:Uncharacterized protein n=1 Tax=Amborella trichopoda TaxID=13333 RepID=W1NRB1_AMBTC|nr:hypothetical protein AMTR_s00088p00042740 [Amborella trichopoda]
MSFIVTRDRAYSGEVTPFGRRRARIIPRSHVPIITQDGNSLATSTTALAQNNPSRRTASRTCTVGVWKDTPISSNIIAKYIGSTISCSSSRVSDCRKAMPCSNSQLSAAVSSTSSSATSSTIILRGQMNSPR